MTDVHYRKLENLYSGIPIGQFYDTTRMTVSKGKAEISLEIHPKYHMGLGLTHGSVYFRMLDDACFYACMSLETEFHLLTSQFNVQFLKPAVKGIITAKAEVNHQLDHLFMASAVLFNESGQAIGLGSGQFKKSKIQLSDLEYV